MVSCLDNLDFRKFKISDFDSDSDADSGEEDNNASSESVIADDEELFGIYFSTTIRG